MTKNYFYLLLMMISFTVLSCSKDDDDNKLDPQGDCFTAKIDGASFESDNVTGSLFGGLLNIGATFGTTNVPTFGLNIWADSEGTFDIVPSSGTTATAQYSPAAAANATDSYLGSSGTLVIEDWDKSNKTIRGTFEFEGINSDGETISVTDGFFDLTYF